MENNKLVRVCVHDGMFHADEVVALAIIMIAFGKDNVEYTRSRNSNDFISADFVVDEGGLYDGVKFFDHHQIDFHMVHEGTDIQYASAGLVWDRFCPTIACRYLKNVNMPRTNKFYTYVVNDLILGIDAVDNGQFKDSDSIHQNTLSSIVKTFNVDNYITNCEEQNSAFEQVVDFVCQYLHKFFENVAHAIYDEDIVLNAYSVAKNGIMILSKFIPSWKNVLLRVDAEHKVKVCLVEAKPGEWSITSALKEANSMEPLCPSPLFLRGVDKSDGATLRSGVFTFVHKTGYTGGFRAATTEEAIEVAEKWIELSDKPLLQRNKKAD